MRTDTIFHQIFSCQPNALFELLDQPDLSQYYQNYVSVEVKEKSYRFDGVLFPLLEPSPLLFVEVQMQLDPNFFRRFIAEVMLYLHQQNYAGLWRMIVIFKDPSIKPTLDPAHQQFVDLGLIEMCFLSDLLLHRHETDSLALDTLRLIITPDEQAVPLARKVLQQSQFSSPSEPEHKLGKIIEMIVLGKFPKLTREEVQAMLNLDFDVKQTKIYQEAIAEGEQIGIQKGEQIGIQKGETKAMEKERQKMGQHLIEALMAKFGPLPDVWHEAIRKANSDQLLDLYGKAMMAKRLDDVAL